MATDAASERPLRRDAERNRQRILAAARVVFAEHGLGASMDAIAREAGVGVGTVYRRFPDKELLIEALFEEGLDEVVGLAEEGLRAEDPWEGLAGFLERSISIQAKDRGLKELLLSTSHGRARIERGRDRIVPVATALIVRAQEAGKLRPDVSPSDFPLIQFALGSVFDYTREIEPEAWRRCLGIVLDGLRVRRDEPTALPIAPLATEQIERAMSCWSPSRR